MLAQTPVQIAWGTRNPYALEIAYASPDIQQFYDYAKQEQE